MSKGANGVLIFRVVCILLLSILVIRGCIIPGWRFAEETNLTEQETAEKTEKYRLQYLSFFKKGVREKLVLVNNFSSKTKSNYLEFSYNDVSVFMHLVDMGKGSSFNNFITLEKQHFSDTPYIVYSGSEGGNVKFLYSSKSNESVDKLIITYDVNLAGYKVEGDSLININYKANSTTFRYGKNEATDMVFTSTHDRPIQFNVVVLKGNKQALIIVAVPSKEIDTGLSQLFIKSMLE